MDGGGGEEAGPPNLDRSDGGGGEAGPPNLQEDCIVKPSASSLSFVVEFIVEMTPL